MGNPLSILLNKERFLLNKVRFLLNAVSTLLVRKDHLCGRVLMVLYSTVQYSAVQYSSFYCSRRISRWGADAFLNNEVRNVPY